MRNLKRRITAILTAAVMTLSAAGTVSAQDEEAPKYTGWTIKDGEWYYLENGEPCTLYGHKIDGVLRYFNANGEYLGGQSGIVFENGKARHYKNGLPITGWTETKYGKQYCLDGYAVTGEFPINGEICRFNSTGIYKVSRTPEVSAACADKVSTDSEKIKIILENIDGKSHEFKIAKCFEYFKDGEWVSCKNTSSYIPLSKGVSQKGEKCSFEVDVSEYSKNKFNVGFYRLPIICGEKTYYAVFEAVAPVEVKSRKEEYIYDNYGINANKASVSDIKLDFTLNSEKTKLLKENIEVRIEKQTENGWENIETDGLDIALTNSENKVTIIPYIYPEDGYYRATVSMGKFSATGYFFMRYMKKHKAEAWLDEYDLNDKDLTITFTVQNCEEEPIKVHTKPFIMHKYAYGAWEYSHGGLDDIEIDANAYTILKGGNRTAVNFNLSDYYDISKLEAGEYAVEIGGIGLAEFTLTDKPMEKNLPFKDLKAEDVKEIIIVDGHAWERYTAIIRPGSAETKIIEGEDEDGTRIKTATAQNDSYFNRTINYLRQFEIKNIYKNYETYVGGRTDVTIVYKDGTKTVLSFETNGAVFYNDKIYHCGKYANPALRDFVMELTELTEDSYYGYRNFG